MDRSLRRAAAVRTVANITVATCYYTYGDSDVISFHIYASYGLRRHLVGKTLRNVCYCDVI